jgi:tetratricopeptide (TPR) repeat protein
MRFKFLILSVIFSLSLFARKADDGEVFFNTKQYLKAKTVYENLLKKKPNDALYNYRYARCCYELKDPENAILHFQLSGTKFPIRDLYLGELYFKTYRFDQSVSAYQTFINTLDSTDSKRSDLKLKLKRAENAARLLTKVEDIAIVDSIVVNKSEFLKFYKFSSELGSLTQETLNMPHKRKADKIKYMTQRQDRMYFSDSIQGNMNIFTSYKLLDSWSKPTSVSDVINTSANENYPFLLMDGVTVYFASDGENSIGGYDLFVTRFNPSTDTYLAPENIGFPFNSPANDYMMVIDEQNKLGWFATDRNQSTGKVVIYSFITNATKTIFRSENQEIVRSAAQLKTYRKISTIKTDSLIDEQGQMPELEKQIEFVVNDSTVYTHVKQFKSPEALKLWNEFSKLSNNYKNKQKELAELRAKYEMTDNSEKRNTLAPQIIEMENKMLEMKKQLSIKTVEVRNAEVKFLKEK